MQLEAQFVETIGSGCRSHELSW